MSSPVIGLPPEHLAVTGVSTIMPIVVPHLDSLAEYGQSCPSPCVSLCTT